MRPVLSELRLDAERAITLLAEARAARARWRIRKRWMRWNLVRAASTLWVSNFRPRMTVDALYDQARTSLRRGQTETRSEVLDLLYTIGSNNGRMEDIRDGYTLLRDLYRQAWLRDNRPYWLQNNLDRYEPVCATVDWPRRALAEPGDPGWYDTHTLPCSGRRRLPEPAADPCKVVKQ